jgi:hypothetical protein
MPTMQDLYDDWVTHSSRRILLVDEAREPAPADHREFVAFFCVAASVELVNDVLNGIDDERGKLPLQARNATIKGKTLFGPRRSRRHDVMREVVSRALRRADRVLRLVTTQKHLWTVELSGGIRAVGDDQTDAALLSGPELVPVMNFLKWVAIRMKLPAEQVDVVIDRSRQLGLSPEQTKTAKDTFNVLGPGHLNTLSGGGKSEVQCPAMFRIIAGSDQLKHLRDLLLLPDTIAYLNLFKTDVTNAKNKVLDGEMFWVDEVDLPALQRAMERPSRST